ncbi:MAG: alpha/beta fold hydrolase [Alphaproteobacteria bacterium]
MATSSRMNQQPATASDRVVLLHGIGHSRHNMYFTARALRREGFTVTAISYPSLRHNIAALAGFLEQRLGDLEIWKQPGRVHFVTHSMGGLLLRHYLDTRRDRIPAGRLGRVVMLGPPHGGSEFADFLRNFPPYKWIYGPAGQELTTAARALDGTEPYYELGIVAGTSGWPCVIANRLIPAPHDGRVAVARTRLPGMKDHITLPATHTLMAWQPAVHRQIVHFLQEGVFLRGR